MSDNDKINNLVYLRDGGILAVDAGCQLYAINGSKARRLHVQRINGFTVARFGEPFEFKKDLFYFVQQPKEAE